MFEKSEMLYLYVETPLHAGSGSSVGVIDLPIQRERVTGYPLVQSSGVKGKLRAEAREALKNKEETDIDEKIALVFGPESDSAQEHAGALSPGDARLLLFPVRSLVGVFAWTTSRNVLARFKRDLEAAGKKVDWDLTNLPDNGNAWTVDQISAVAGGKVVLEEFAFTAATHADVKIISDWIAENVFPGSAEYTYFQEKVRTNLVILPEDAFRDFAQFATEVITRIKIDQETKTVARGALWTEEHLPSDTVLYSPLHTTRPRKIKENKIRTLQSAGDVLQFVRDLGLERIQLGGDETVGRGIVRLNLSGGNEL
ncbi:MAG: type III-B CRISPR module RAMP protein Cmr4 [Acidobacteria bacterium]|nr:type III-B CRISPR module RAMP protein Cmr4 [Acidobacteriota bacterium]